jgi:hypothetical protein
MMYNHLKLAMLKEDNTDLILGYKFSQPPWVLRTDLYQFLRIFRTQKAERLGRLLDPYPTAPLFVPFPSSDTPALAPLASTHCLGLRCVLRFGAICPLWQAPVSPIFRQSEIVTFITTVSWHDGRQRCSIKTHRNNRKCDRKQLLDVIYTGVGVGGRGFTVAGILFVDLRARSRASMLQMWDWWRRDIVVRQSVHRS